MTWYAVVAPVGTPEPVLATLRKELAATLNDPAVVERVRGFGAEASFGGPDEYATLINLEMTKWGPNSEASQHQASVKAKPARAPGTRLD